MRSVGARQHPRLHAVQIAVPQPDDPVAADCRKRQPLSIRRERDVGLERRACGRRNLKTNRARAPRPAGGRLAHDHHAHRPSERHHRRALPQPQRPRAGLRRSRPVVIGVSSDTQSSACLTSRADCHRLSASFSRQVCTTRSMPLGVSGRSSRDRPRLLLEDRRDDACRTVAVEGPLPGDELVEHEPEREDVAARVGLLPFELLRRHVLQRAEDRAGAGRRAADRRHVRRQLRRGLGQAEVEELDAALGDEDVRRLQIPVDDAVAVRGVEGIEDLPREHQRFIEIDRARQAACPRCTPSPGSPARRRRASRCADGSGGDRVRLALEAFAEGRETF